MAHFDFRNLEAATRTNMIAEIDHDVAQARLYLSPRLTSEGLSAWEAKLKAACETGDDQSLEASLGLPGGPFLEDRESDTNNGGTKAVPSNAATVLAQGEFNRFYIRALCLRAIEEARGLRIYRARMSSRPDAASESKIGASLDPHDLLADLRQRPGIASAMGLPPRPNSGLSVELT